MRTCGRAFVNQHWGRGPLPPLLLVILAMACAGASAPSGRFIVTLEKSVFTAGTGGPHDLEVEFECVDGRIAPAAWAWLPFLPWAEHPARVTGGGLVDGELKIQFTVQLRGVVPACAGGTLTGSVELSEGAGNWRGGYRLKPEPVAATRAAELWKSAGRKPPVAFAFALDASETQSVTEVNRRAEPVRATAVFTPLPAPSTRPTREGRPRVLFTRADLPSIAGRAHSGEGREIVARLRELARAGVGGDAGPKEKLPCAGFLAAGWAMIARLEDDRQAAGESAAAAKHAIAEITEGVGAQGIAAARSMAGLAVAYDLGGEWWEPALRAEAAALLARTAARVAMVLPEAPIGPLDDPEDYGLACWRSAGALAALAVEGERGAEALGEAGQVVAFFRQSLGRFISSAIGNAGWGTGSTGFDEAIELLVPAVRALRVAGSPVSRDLASYGPEPHFVFGGSNCFTTPARRRGGGLAQVGMYAIMAGGRPFDEVPGSDGWLPFVCDVAPAGHLPYLRRLWEKGYRPANTFHALYALLSAPIGIRAEDPTGRLPLSYEDRERGGYILRSGWGEKDFVLTCEAAARTERPAAYRRGHFSLSGLGRDWICRPQSPFGTIAHLPQTELNVTRVDRSRLSGIGPAYPLYGGKIDRVRVSPDGSGSISLTGYGFHGPIRGHDEQIEDTTAPYPGLARRTIAVDYSRRSGADALLVIVEAPTFVGDREQIFELNVGDVPISQVNCENATFTVRPADGKAVMRGTVLYPAMAWATYRPPLAGRPGRIAIHRSRPAEGALDSFARRIEKRLDDAFADLDRASPRSQKKSEQDDEDFGSGSEEEVLTVLRKLSVEADRLESQHYALYAKMYKHTRSFPQHLKAANKYGVAVSRFATDRRVRALNHWVVVITVGSQEPAVVSMPIEEENLCTVGSQTVSYEEFLVKFGTPSSKSLIEKAKDEP